MSDSDRWWVIALLVVFMVGGLLWLLLAHMRRPAPATTATAPDWHEAAADGLGVGPRTGPARAVSTADVTMSRGPYPAEAIAATTDGAPDTVAVTPAGDVGAIEQTEMDATLAAGGDLAADANAAPAGGSTLEGLGPDAGSATVGSELSDTSWASAAAPEAAVSAFVAVPDAGTAPSFGWVLIAEVHHGADGDEHGDHEWVVLTNSRGEAVDLAGWRLADEGTKHSYTLPAHTLPVGGSVRVHMAHGEDGETDLYVGRSQRWWNNEGDCAYLYDASGRLVFKFCYGCAASA